MVYQTSTISILILYSAMSFGCSGDDVVHTDATTLSGVQDAVQSSPQVENPLDAITEVFLDATVDARSIDQDVGPAEPTIADLLENTERFSEVLRLVNIIGLVDAMRGPGPFTVFVPINVAVLSLPAETLARVEDEQGYLHRFILAHVAEGDLPLADFETTTIIEMIGQDVQIATTLDGETLVGDARIIDADLKASNGRIHVIDSVIPVTDIPNE